MLDAFDDLQKLWVEGVAGAAENYGKAEESQEATESAEKKNSIRETEDVSPVAVVNNDAISQHPFSYASLVSKPDMKVTVLDTNVPKNRADIISQAKQNARKIGVFNVNDGSVSVPVKDIGDNVILGTAGLKHGLDRRLNTNAAITVNPKYFVGSKVENTGNTWEQCKKYAPIALIKEMGMFDTDMGRSTVDYIKAKEYGSLSEKAAAFIKDSDYRDEVLGWAPGKADEVTWCAIWNACKRKVATEQKLTGEQLLKASGDLFTEVITKTQVYDSVFSRSANMRSKTAFMNMATSFMAEPTTTANMLEAALRKMQNGYTKAAAKDIAAVGVAAVLNAFLVSFVYAARDDDEDKTYLEKYLSTFAVETLDSLNPATMVPYMRDIWSMMQGYSLERADMSLLSDAINTMNRLGTLVLKDTSRMTEEEQEAYWASVKDSGWKAADSIFSIFGISEKNIRRDLNAIVNLFQATNWKDSSANTIWNAVWDEVKASTPILRNLPKDSKSDRLYQSQVSGDAIWKSREESRYGSQKQTDAATKKGLRENDPRIRDAAKALNDGENDERIRITREIIADGKFSQDIVMAAIQAEAASLREKEQKEYRLEVQSLYTVEDYAKALAAGKANAVQMRSEILRASKANGKTAEKAESNLKSNLSSTVRDLYEDGSFDKLKAVAALVNSGLYEQQTADNKVDAWNFKTVYGYDWDDRKLAFYDGAISSTQLVQELVSAGKSREDAEEQVRIYSWQKGTASGCEGISWSAIEDYTTYCVGAGISKDDYYAAWKGCNAIKSDYDSRGKSISGSRAQKIARYLNTLRLTAEQKTAIMRCYYVEKTVRKYKIW